jgi:hypothetical protein
MSSDHSKRDNRQHSAESDESEMNDRSSQLTPAAKDDEAVRFRALDDPTNKDRIAQRNRYNAQHSTGPRTPRGKKFSSRNSLKHSVFAKTLLIPNKLAAEDSSEYEALLSRIVRHYNPIGFEEEFWTEKIAMELWRLRRFKRFESGIAARVITEYVDELQQGNPDPSKESVPPLSPSMPVPVDHLLIPNDSDRLIRYEALISRQLEKALMELDRLQHRRREITPTTSDKDLT